MSLDENKQAARELIAAITSHDADRLESLMTEDATYWVQGKPHLFPHAGLPLLAGVSRQENREGQRLLGYAACRRGVLCMSGFRARRSGPDGHQVI